MAECRFRARSVVGVCCGKIFLDRVVCDSKKFEQIANIKRQTLEHLARYSTQNLLYRIKRVESKKESVLRARLIALLAFPTVHQSTSTLVLLFFCNNFDLVPSKCALINLMFICASVSKLKTNRELCLFLYRKLTKWLIALQMTRITWAVMFILKWEREKKNNYELFSRGTMTSI